MGLSGISRAPAITFKLYQKHIFRAMINSDKVKKDK
jgi:hypothetical protein